VKKVLVLGGDFSSAKKIADLNLQNLSDSRVEYFFIENVSIHDSQNFLDKTYRELIACKKTQKRAKLKFTYNISKSFYSNSSFRIHLKVILFSNYKLSSRSTLGLILSHIRKNNLIYLLLISSIGFIRIPDKLVSSFLSIGLPKCKEFLKLIEIANFDMIVLLTSGRDNIHFLLNTFKKLSKIKYVMLIENWDGPTSKNLVSGKFDVVGAWNEQQVAQLKRISGFDQSKTHVIGSTTADLAYKQYSSHCRPEPYKTRPRKLLFIGQRNNYDEISDVLQLIEILPKTHFDRLVYRPHPLSQMKSKRIFESKSKLGKIEIDTSKALNLYEFSGVITLPTSLLLEVLLSDVPAIIYLPGDRKNRRTPRIMWKYEHFDIIKSHNPITIIHEIENLKKTLLQKFPSQSPLNFALMEKLLPKLEGTYSQRINALVRKTLLIS